MKYEIKVDGIKCSHCVKSIKESLKLIDETLNCDIDIKKGIVIIESQDERPDLDKIKAAICDLGFDIV